MDAPLDFEFEAPLSASRVGAKNRNKVFALDDLVSDYFKEKEKEVVKKHKRIKSRSSNVNEKEDHGKEALLSEKIRECHKKMTEMGAEEEFSAWGLCIFGVQKEPVLISCALRSSSMLHSTLSNMLSSMDELKDTEVETFFEGCLVNGWLSTLVCASRHVGKSLCKWTFDLMLYSAKEELMVSACKFWCTICTSKQEHRIETEWVPTYSDLKVAMETYGYVIDFSLSGLANLDSKDRGPPQNIRIWLKFVAECFWDSTRFTWSSQEVGHMVEILLSLSVERKLQGSNSLLRAAVRSVVDCFHNEEWNDSCNNIAMNLARRIPGDLNCLRVLEFISGVSIRLSQLRSAVSYRFLLEGLELEAKTEQDILLSLTSINLKDKNCDIFKMHIYLHLADSWISSDRSLQTSKVIHEMFGQLLRNCTSHISTTDFRPYASKVRSKASYLVHGYSYDT